MFKYGSQIWTKDLKKAEFKTHQNYKIFTNIAIWIILVTDLQQRFLNIFLKCAFKEVLIILSFHFVHLTTIDLFISRCWSCHSWLIKITDNINMEWTKPTCVEEWGFYFYLSWLFNSNSPKVKTVCAFQISGKLLPFPSEKFCRNELTINSSS